MTNEMKRVPELRFPEFNREWEYNLFSEIVTNKSKRFDPKNEESLKDIELDSIEQNTGRLLNTYMSKDFTSQKNKFDKGSVLYSKLRPYLNKYYYAKIDGVCSSEIWVLNSLYSQKLSNLFLYYFIQTNRFSNVANKSAGSKMPRADWSLVENIRLYKGSIEEQRKIGDFFSKLDRQIELEEQKLSLLEEQKKGYMQQIFSQELRFKDENGNDYPTWKKTTIKEVAKLTVGKSKKNENTGKYIIMDMGTVTKNGTMLTHKSTPHENDLLNKGDLVMPKDDIGGGHIIGKTVFIPESQKYVLGDHVYRLETKKCNGLFLHFYINSDIVNRSLKRKVTGSAQLGLNRKSVEEELVKVPCLEEQEKIGAFFSKLDTFIEKQLSKIELLKERKKGFLQKMFV